MASLVNAAIGYFDLQSRERGVRRTRGFSEGDQHLTVLPQYIALVLGIVAQPYLMAFQATGSWSVTLTSFVSWTVFALLVGLCIFPGVYKKSFDPGQPRFVQFCTIFVAGIGWKALFATAVKAAGADT